jgi:alpha-1,3-rhamnosyl/mannosyltransferase
LEAFASETCVVTSNRGALRQVAGDAALLVDPEQESAIRDAMLNVAEDERLRRSLIARGRLRVQGMSWRRHAEATVKVYRELL